LNSAEIVPQAVSSVESHTKPGLDPKVSRQVIESVIKPNVTIVIPTLNEAEAISQVIEELRKEDYQNIMVVDGYSTDRSDSIAIDNGVKLVYQHGEVPPGRDWVQCRDRACRTISLKREPD
jgi:cellulose synthase/poly-beta-1,6-N-acetylglucosamine synthase-like glycosyltransferase